MLDLRRPSLKIWSSVFVSCLLVAAFHLIYLDKFYYSCVVEIDFSAGQADTLVFYFPDKEGKYHGRHSAKIQYSMGEQNKKLTIPLRHSDKPVIIDPGNRANGLTLQRLSISRFGFIKHLTPHQIEQYIVKANDIELVQIEEGLKLSFSSGNPVIFLQGLPVPNLGLQKSFIFSIGLAVFTLIFSLLLFRLFQGRTTNYYIGPITITLILLVVGSRYSWPYLVLFLLYFFLSYCLIKTITSFFHRDFKMLSTVSLGQILVIICFLLLLTWPLYRIISPKVYSYQTLTNTISQSLTASEEENLQNRLTSLFDDIENTFTSHFPFNDRLLNLNANIKIFYLGFSPTSKSILGKNGMFFEGYGERRVEADVVRSFDNITDYMGLSPFTEDELEQWLICLEERYYWLKDRGIDYIFVLAPTKALVYTENLPSSILDLKTKLNKPTRYEQLVSYLRDKSIVPIVDLRNHLVAAKNLMDAKGSKEDLLLYYRTDFHWNYLGSFFAYQAIVDEINRAYPKYQLEASQLAEFELQKRTDWVHDPFIYQLGLNPAKQKNETYLTLFPKSNSIYSEIADFGTKGINDNSSPKQIIRNFGGIDQKVRIINNPKAKLSSIFVIGDSFSEKYLGFFSKHAKETISFRTVYSFLPQIYMDKSPDLVVQEILNMYLLNHPPVNPKGIRDARINALERQKTTSTVF